MSALPVKIPSRYTHRRWTSIHTSKMALILFNRSSQAMASSSNTWGRRRRGLGESHEGLLLAIQPPMDFHAILSITTHE